MNLRAVLLIRAALPVCYDSVMRRLLFLLASISLAVVGQNSNPNELAERTVPEGAKKIAYGNGALQFARTDGQSFPHG